MEFSDTKFVLLSNLKPRQLRRGFVLSAGNTVKIAKIIVHCSDTPEDMDIGVKEIKKWHTDPPPKGRGWRDCGYHKVIRRNGQTEIGRFENGDSVLEGKEIGAHTKGHNSDSLAVCLVGRGKYDPRQIASLLYCLHRWLVIHDLEPSDVYGHYEFDKNKGCPLLDMGAVRKVLASMSVGDSVA